MVVSEGTGYRVDPRRTPGYRVARLVFEALCGTWFRPVVSGREKIPAEGAVILAPVHRSFADFGFNAFVTDRKLFFMAKDELWERRSVGRLLDGLGAFPVNRAAADREALRRAEAVLRQGQALVLFPEGTRKSGPEVAPLLEGAAFLAARTGAPIVPIGIGGSDLAMPKGLLVPRPLRIRVVVGDPLTPPVRAGTGRVPRSTVHATTEALRLAVQKAYDEARAGSR
ncbi:MAG: lysophospholipid acyltransferase family protein [Acidimicrobiales bacterium]